MTSSPIASPDYNQMATHFDRYLPQIQPVAAALLAQLPAPASGETILDVACGTGEPGLTLARRAPGVFILGVDRAEAMIAVARSKAAREGLTNARFEVMASETLALADGSVDGVLSRFGLLMFGDVRASAQELARVLRPRGHFSLAVWDDMGKNTLFYTALKVLRGYLPSDYASPVDGLNAWAGEGLRTQLLKDAGMAVVHSEMFSWAYHFDSFDEAWGLISGMGNFTGQSTLPQSVQQQVAIEVSAALEAYRQSSGAYVIPHSCRLIWGQR